MKDKGVNHKDTKEHEGIQAFIRVTSCPLW